jgi:autotransporter adhesin
VNKIYNVVWDAQKQCFVVASELAKGHKKPGSAKLSLAIAGALLVGGLSAPAMSATGSGLKAGLALMANYYSVNDSGVQGGNYNSDGATGANALAAGVGASAAGSSGVAVGTDASASGNSAIAMGDSSVSTGLMTTSVGAGAQAIADTATALGSTTSATGFGSTAVGYGANAAGSRALASGYGTSASGDNSTALGNSAKALVADGVALGSKSAANTAAGIAGYVPATATAAQAAAINATKSTLGAVSVGDAATNKFRQITSVAAGTADSDAVNVAQLKGATADAVLYDSSAHDSITLGGPAYNPVTKAGGTKITNLANGVAPSDAVNKSQLDDLANTPLTFAGNTGTVQKKLGDTMSIQGKGTTSGTYVGDNLRTEVDASGALQVEMTDKPEFTSVTTGNTTIDTNGVVITGGPSMTANGINAGGQKIGNVAAGTALTDAVNVNQLSTAVNGAKSHYFSVNDGAVQGGNYDNDGATGTNALAAGMSAGAAGNSAVAVGPNASASGTSSVAVGDGSVSIGLMTTGVGANAQALSDTATALGSTTSATGFGSTAVGFGANAAGARTLAGGYGATASADSSIALGNSAKALVADGVAIGSKSVANTAAGIAGYVPVTATTAQTAAINATASTLGGVSVGDAASNKFRQITGVAAGTADSDAVNVAQLKGATADAVIYDTGAHDSVTLGGPTYDPVSKTGGTKITNVADGVAPSDAVNKSQLDDLADTPLSFAGNTGTVQKKLGDTMSIQGKGTTAGTYVGDNLRTEVDANGVLQIEMTDKPEFTSVTTGNTIIDTNGVVITGGPSITVNGIDAGGTKITNVTAGTAPSDAVNVSQLTTTVNGAKTHYYSVNDSGTQGGNYNNDGATGANAIAAGVGAKAIGASSTAMGSNAQANNDNDVALGAGSVTSRSNPISSVTVAGQTYQFAGTNPTSVVSVGSKGNERQITNVAAGQLSGDSTDAVNGSQLYATNQAVDVLNGTINTINGGGGIKYFHANSSLADSQAVGSNSVAVGPQAVSTGADSVAIGNGAKASTNNSVALGANSTTGPVKGTSGATIAGDNYTFAGANPTGTVSVGAAGQERTITNVAAGTLSSTSTDAVNGSQLYATNQAVDKIDGRVTTVENTVNHIAGDITNISTGQAGMFQTSTDQKAPTPTPTGNNSAAGGAGATASGDNSLALGNGSQASANNSVAIGNASVADRANAVSMGSSGNERQITNVAAGSQGTDAVNVSQLKAAQAGGVQYDVNSDGSINYNAVTLNPNGGGASIHNVQAGTATTDAVNVGQLNDAVVSTQNWAKNYTDQQINQMGKRAYAGTASALATANIPQAYQPNQSVVGVGIGNYHGQNAISVGLSTITESGRYILKASATGSQQDGLGVGVGAGMAW